MNRPKVICHMASSVDGRIIGEEWGSNLKLYGKLYEQCHNSFDSQAWMVVRVTMEKEKALTQLYDAFKIRTLMLEGGGNINGSLLNAGLIDEVSLLILPIADGNPDNATTFEVADYLPEKAAQQLKLIDVKKLEHDVLWLRYKTS